MAVQRQMDAVDAILQQWPRERPDLDVSPMGVIGRLGRCAALLRRGVPGFHLAALLQDGAPPLRRGAELRLRELAGDDAARLLARAEALVRGMLLAEDRETAAAGALRELEGTWG